MPRDLRNGGGLTAARFVGRAAKDAGYGPAAVARQVFDDKICRAAHPRLRPDRARPVCEGRDAPEMSARRDDPARRGRGHRAELFLQHEDALGVMLQHPVPVDAGRLGRDRVRGRSALGLDRDAWLESGDLRRVLRRRAAGRELEGVLGRERCQFIEADVTREADVKALFHACSAKWGRVDCLFNNAGASIADNGIETISVDDFDWIVASVLRSSMLGMKHVAPIMMAQKSGSIINNGSIAGQRAGYSSSLVYSAAKAAVIQLTRCVAMQLGEHRIRVNSISPGAIAMGVFGKAFGLEADKADATADVVKGAFAGVQPIPRAGLPDDIANAAVFLASDESSFVNGHDLLIDGGLSGGRQWSVQRQGIQAMRNALSAVSE
jgi:NAD(P)-dependent dehydrogenase (short-subunit alcohol dehydrogenase family)